MDPSEFILPLAGIGLIVLLVWLTGGARLYPISRAAANEALLAEGLTASRIVVSRDGATGLAWIEDLRRAALIRRMGRDISVTLLEQDDIGRMDMAANDLAMTLRFRSMGQSPARILLQDEDEMEHWRRVLMPHAEPKVDGAR